MKLMLGFFSIDV